MAFDDPTVALTAGGGPGGGEAQSWDGLTFDPPSGGWYTGGGICSAW